MPILLTKIEDTVVAGTGRWMDGIYRHEELKYAVTLGYEVEVLYGYHFDKKKIFNKFVNALYSMRLKYDKSDPRNLCAKLILNSLYGRAYIQVLIKSLFTLMMYSIVQKLSMNTLTGKLLVFISRKSIILAIKKRLLM